EPSALDRRPSSAPLRLTREAAQLVLTWEPQAGRGADVYQGTLASLHDARRYDHAGMGACEIPDGRLALDVPPGGVYFLVAGTCGWGDGSLGRDSLGRER